MPAMGLGWYITLESDLGGVDTSTVEGKSLVMAQHELNTLAEQLGLPPLATFLSTDPAVVGHYLESQGLNPDDFPLPEQEWFQAAEGLRTVQGLRERLRRDPRGVPGVARVVTALEAMERILADAHRRQV